MFEMKIIKGICLFFVYPTAIFLFGFAMGMKCDDFFYPYKSGEKVESKSDEDPYRDIVPGIGNETSISDFPNYREVGALGETLTDSTEFVVEEYDALRGDRVEVIEKLPPKYVGMNRKQLLDSFREYKQAPPLSEQERGFENLELLSFSPERIKIRMTYRYVQPGEDFYIAIKENEVVVYLADRKTLYIQTGIPVEGLTETMQLELIEMIYVADEEELYSMLESISS